MTLLTALAFVALGFVAGCGFVAGAWRLMTQVESETSYDRGHANGRMDGKHEGVGKSLSLCCEACSDRIMKTLDPKWWHS